MSDDPVLDSHLHSDHWLKNEKKNEKKKKQEATQEGKG